MSGTDERLFDLATDTVRDLNAALHAADAAATPR